MSLPDSWKIQSLQDLCRETISYGIVQCGPHIRNGIPYIRVSDMDRRELDVEGMLRTSPDIAARFVRSTVEAGDLVYALRGKLGEVRKVPLEVAGANLTQGTARIAPRSEVSSDYLMWAMRGPDAIRQAGYQAKGSTFVEITLENLRNIQIAVPPATEQRAIATTLSDVDAMIAGLEKLIAKKRNLKQAAMQQLLTGQTRLPGFDGEWVVKALGDIADLYQPETISQTSFTDHGYPVFGANGVVGMYSRFNHSTPQVTISCRGNCGTVNLTRGPAWITGNAMVVNLDGAEGVDKSYVYHALNYSDLSVLVTGSGIPQIVREPLSKFVINIPADIQEQSAIGSFLSDLDDEIALVEVRLTKTRDLKQGMMQELLTGRIRLV